MIGESRLNTNTVPKIKIKTVALPAEHGGWGFLLEPIFVGLIIAPSVAGLFLSLATIGAFLTRFPLKLCVMDWRRGRELTRTALARKFVLIYGIITIVFFLLTVKTARSDFLIPLLIALPFAIWQLISDFTNNSRSLSAELAGAIALASVSSSMTIIAGWSFGKSLCIWLILSTRIVPSICYVRARLRINRGETINKKLVILFHVIGLAIVCFIVWLGFGPTLAVIAFLVLFIRAIHGFSNYSKIKTAKAVGIREVIYGTLTAIALAVGYAFNL
jgi:hypothetical protein